MIDFSLFSSKLITSFPSLVVYLAKWDIVKPKL